MKLLTREEFREDCLIRDNNKCVICGSNEDLVVHHIIERRLFDNGGYFLENGSTLCPSCYIKAETTDLSCEEIRVACGIKKVALPDDYYHDHRYDKWGNIILDNSQRMKGLATVA